MRRGVRSLPWTGLGVPCAAALVLSACEYRVELDLGPEGQAAYRLTVRDRGLGPEALGSLVGMMQAPWLRVDRGVATAAGDVPEISIEGSIDTMTRVGEVKAFHGVTCYWQPLPGGRTLFQLVREPLGLREQEGELRAHIRFPCSVSRTNGRKAFGDRTVVWRIPVTDLARRELRLWAVMEPGAKEASAR